MKNGDWPPLDERRRMIVDFCKGRMLAPAVLKQPAKTYEDMKFSIIRYRVHKEQLYFADDPDEYLEVVEHITKRFGKPNSGMYASNSVYHHRHPTITEVNQPDNVKDYLGMIDIDHVLGNEELARELIRGILEKLPDEGVWLLISGSGIHIKINGFRSHIHAASFIAARGIEGGRQPTADSPIKVDLLNDVSRIGTVPFEVYKKDKGVLCFPFMPEELDDVFNRPDWRAYYSSSYRTPWTLDPAPDVLAWNMRSITPEPKRTMTPIKRMNNMKVKVDKDFYEALPGCVEAAFRKDISDGRHKTISFLATFMNKIGVPERDILDILTIRGLTWPHPLDPDEVQRVVFDVIDKGLEPPGCHKVRSNKGENPYPYADLGHLNFCPYGTDMSHGCVERNPANMFEYNKFYN